MAVTEYNYIPTYTKLEINNKSKDVITASYWNGLFNSLSRQGDHTAKELGNILNHFTTVITGAASDTAAAIAEEHEYASAFEIHLSTNANPITADKTFAEIRQAIVDKREILLWVSEVQCLKPTCKAFEHTIYLVVFDYSPAGPVVRADVYECYDENEWFVEQNIELAKQNDVGDIRNLTTTHKYNLVAAINDKQDKLIAGENITIAADGKTISATGGGATVELDTTLSAAGKAADAKAVGDALADKQDTVSDLATIRSGAAKGATALQTVPSTYRTALAQDVIDSDLSDRIEVIEGKEAGWNGKQDKLIAGNNITIAADGKTISAIVDGASVAMRVNGGYIQYSIDNGSTWVNLIAKADLKGDKGDTGATGAAGKSAYQYAQDGGYTGTETEFAKKLASEAMIVTITDNNGTLSADKSYIEIRGSILAGIPVLVSYDGTVFPLIALSADALCFGTIQCDSGDASNGAVVATVIIEITPNGEVNDISAFVETLPNPNAITFTGAVTGSYDGSAPLIVEIPSAVTDAHINSLIDTKLGVIENGSY